MFSLSLRQRKAKSLSSDQWVKYASRTDRQIKKIYQRKSVSRIVLERYNVEFSTQITAYFTIFSSLLFYFNFLFGGARLAPHPGAVVVFEF